MWSLVALQRWLAANRQVNIGTKQWFGLWIQQQLTALHCMSMLLHEGSDICEWESAMLSA